MPEPQSPMPSDDIHTRMQSRPATPAEPTPRLPGNVPPVAPSGQANRLGQYRLLQVLGEGGMGTVWLAEDEHLRRKAAVKVMRPELARDGVARERFVREARAMAAVDSDHVVAIYAAGEQDGVPYLAMPLLPGEPLDQWLLRHPSPDIAEIIRVGRQTAQGLADAHAQGLIHRDVKPSNLWREPSGRIKVLDFGLARPVQGAEVQGVELTSTGQMLGTPAYMAPEQTRGKGVDHRCDLFSLGGVLYRMCGGLLPFPGETPYEVLAALMMDEPAPIRSLNDRVPEALADLIHRLLAKDPAGRPASAQAVVEELRRLEGGAPAADSDWGRIVPSLPAPEGGATPPRLVPSWPTLHPEPTPLVLPRPPAPPRRIGAGLAAGAAGLLALAVVAVLVLNRGPEPVPSSPAGPAVAAADPKTDEPPSLPKVEVVPPVLLPALPVVPPPVPPPPTPPPPVVVPPPPPPIPVLPPPPPPMPPPPPVVPLPPPPPVVVKSNPPPPPPVVVPKPPPDPFARRTATLDLGGGVKLQLVRIAAGEFLMGSSDDDRDASNDEKPQHRVRIGKDFFLGKSHVTRGQFRRFIEDTGKPSEAETDGQGGHGYDAADKPVGRDPKYNWHATGFDQTDEHPVVNVTWNDAVRFCDWVNDRAGHAKWQCHLPTEAQWEYACRAGTTTRYSCGDDAEGLARVGNVADGTAKKKFPGWPTIRAEDGYVFTAPVGRFPPNPFGLYDMHGNAWQWCADRFGAKYYNDAPTVDPKGPSEGSRHVVRGGSFRYPPKSCRAARRVGYEATLRDCTVGFRVSFRPD